MRRVITVEATELMSGEQAPLEEVDPNGTRSCALRLTLEDGALVKVEVVNVGYVEG
jgi:hypothetical protein